MRYLEQKWPCAGEMGENGENKTGTIQIPFTRESRRKLKAGTARLMRFVHGSSNSIPGEGQDVRD